MTHEPAARGSAPVGTLAEPPPQRAGRRGPFLPSRPLLALVGLLVLLGLAALYHYLIYLPQPDVPHRLTLLDDVFALGVYGLVGLVGLVLGQRALRPFRLEGFSRWERGALAMGLGWGILSLGVLGLGLAHLLYSGVLLLGLLVALAVCWREAWRVWSLLTSGAPYRRLRALVPQGWFLRLLAALVVIELALLGTQMLTLPYAPRGFDVYQYHWAVPQLFLLHHAIYALPGWAHANFPLNSEMLNTLALAWDAPVAATMIQASFGALAVALLVGYLARRFGALAAWVGLSLGLCNNLLAGVLISSYAEPAAAYYAVASLVVVLAWLDREGRSGGIALPLLAGLYAGLGLGVKYTEGQVLLGIVFLLVIVHIFRLSGLRRQGAALILMLKRFMLALAAFGSTTLLALLPWLLKDWVLLGNPIYPFLWGGQQWDAARTEVGVVTFSHFGPHGPLWQRVLFGFFLMFRLYGTEQNDEPFPIPPNVLYLLILLIPLIWAVEEARRRRKRMAPGDEQMDEQKDRSRWGLSWLVVACVGYLAWVLSGAAVVRYALPWALLLVVPCAVLVARAIQVCWKQRVLRALAPATRALTQGAVLAAALLAVTYVGAGWAFTQPLPLMAGNISLRQFEEQTMMNRAYWRMVDYMEQHVPHDARLLLVGSGAGYFLTGFDYVADSGEDWIPYLETEGRTPAGMLTLLRQDHFRYLVYDDFMLSFEVYTYGDHYLGGFLPAFRQFLAGSLRQVWSYQNYHIYAVPPP
jgi:hypothetical protein